MTVAGVLQGAWIMASRRRISQNRILFRSSLAAESPTTMIDVACPQCGEVYHTHLMQAGKSIKCRRCDSLFPILLKGDTIVQQPLETTEIRRPRSQTEQTSVRPISQRNVFRSLGIFGVV